MAKKTAPLRRLSGQAINVEYAGMPIGMKLAVARFAYRQPCGVQATPRKTAWPTKDDFARETCAAGNGGLACLTVRSPSNENFWRKGPFTILKSLFPGDPWLCCASWQDKFYTQRLSAWEPSITRMRLVVPNPMTGPEGLTKSGKTLSAHTLDNTGPRRFLVVEQDSGTLDLQSGVLLELAKTAPLTLVLHSGGKSLHGWFFCEGQSEDALHGWFRGAVVLGADSQLWSRCQFARLPGAQRENGKPQKVLFFNPGTLR